MSKIKEWLKLYWTEYPFQMVGVVLLITTMMLGWMNQIRVGWYAYALAGVITGLCALCNKFGNPMKTVSQTIQDMTSNKLIDYVLGIVIIGFCLWQHFGKYGFEPGMENAYWILPIGLAIHFFANKD